MELKIKFLIENLYGGDGFRRFIQVKKEKWKTERIHKRTKQSTGLTSEHGAEEITYENVNQPVETFDKDEKDNPIQRLGGVHGKIWGHFRAVGKLLADSNEPGFESKAFVDRLMQSVIISPTYPKLKITGKMYIDKIPQITQGRNQAMITQYFDVIPEAEFEAILKFPDVYKDHILKLLKYAESCGAMNKRRAAIKVLNREIFK